MNGLKTFQIEQIVDVEIGQLGPNLKKYIHNKVKNRLENSCDKEYGYISKVGKDIKILPNNIVSTAGPNVFFRVLVDITALKPEQGHRYTARVCQVLPIGLFVEVENKLRILITLKNMVGYVFDKGVFKKGNSTIALNDTVKVVIDVIRYEDQKFSCLGKLIE